MNYILLISCFLLISCIDHDVEDFKKSCPYELKYSGHWLKVPITISPHKMNYNVGDTLSISTIFSDSIYDLGTQQKFKIEGFPFKPHSLLYRFYDDLEWDAGYRVNELQIDPKYNTVYNYSSSFADGYRAYTIYDNGLYSFESNLILKEKGRYILLFSDIYQNHIASGNSELNADADAITFEGKCPTLGYYICSTIQGDDNLRYFEKELLFLDNEIYRGSLRSFRDDNTLDFLGYGKTTVEFSGYFGFEVVE